jgi:hypothetical protein
MPVAPAVHALLSTYPEPVQRLVEDTRRWIRRTLPDAVESVDVGSRLIGYGHGPGYTGAVCTLILSRTGIKLGLVGGAALPDPHRLLRGSGKVHRHVPLTSAQDLRQAGLETLLLGASAAAQARLAATAPVARTPARTVARSRKTT